MANQAGPASQVVRITGREREAAEALLKERGIVVSFGSSPTRVPAQGKGDSKNYDCKNQRRFWLSG